METKPMGFKPNQSQVAEMLGVSTSLLSNWKFMESAIQVDDLERISRITGLTYTELAQAAREDAGHVAAAVELRKKNGRSGVKRVEEVVRPPRREVRRHSRDDQNQEGKSR